MQLTTFLAWCGALFLTLKLVSIARTLYHTFIYKCDFNQFKDQKGAGYALITGSTSGIGEGFSESLASRGWNLLLVSRSASKLQSSKEKLLKKYPNIQIKTCVSEASSLDHAEIDRVVAACKDISLRILVNNVGVSAGPGAGPVVEMDAKHYEEMINVNCRYPTLLTRALLPQLIATSSAQHRTCIINVASQTSFLHVPLCTGYSATKSYNLGWSHALREEVRHQHIEVFALTPGMTQSAMVKADKSSLLLSSALGCASAGLNAVGSAYYHCGYWVHHLSFQIVSSLPDFVRGPILLQSMKDLKKQADEMKKRDEAKGKSSKAE